MVSSTTQPQYVVDEQIKYTVFTQELSSILLYHTYIKIKMQVQNPDLIGVYNQYNQCLISVQLSPSQTHQTMDVVS